VVETSRPRARRSTGTEKLTVTFDEPVNLQLLAHAADLEAGPPPRSGVHQGADGTTYYPRLEDYDPDAYRDEFLMLDGLADGDYSPARLGRRRSGGSGRHPLVVTTRAAIMWSISGSTARPAGWSG